MDERSLSTSSGQVIFRFPTKIKQFNPPPPGVSCRAAKFPCPKASRSFEGKFSENFLKHGKFKKNGNMEEISSYT